MATGGENFEKIFFRPKSYLGGLCHLGEFFLKKNIWKIYHHNSLHVHGVYGCMLTVTLFPSFNLIFPYMCMAFPGAPPYVRNLRLP